MSIQQTTLCLLRRDADTKQVLLGYKKTGFGQGKLTGFGGKIEPGETIEAAALRELKEEAGVTVLPQDLISAGTLTFIFPQRQEWSQQVHTFLVVNWQGEPAESVEMRPEWFDIGNLPFDGLWDDARYWLPPILAGLTYTARFTFKIDNATVEQVTRETENLTTPSLPTSLTPLIASSLSARSDLLGSDSHHTSAIRLFNGFLEGYPLLVVDLYADTLVLHNHANPPALNKAMIAEAQAYYQELLPWIRCVVVKTRSRANQSEALQDSGIVYGEQPAEKIQEHGVWYALDLLRHQDATFYPDTRSLRDWIIKHMFGLRVLNTFAYTGSLGVAALAGGARQVIQLDHNRDFLNLAKTSYTLNGFAIKREDFLVGDFFSHISALKRIGERFDCVLLDPPFFSITSKGRVDLVSQSTRLINKVRPLITDGGWLVAVNNALFLSGNDYIKMLDTLSKDGYLSLEATIPVPPDCAGYPFTNVRSLPADPTPFNHATKIAIMKVRRK